MKLYFPSDVEQFTTEYHTHVRAPDAKRLELDCEACEQMARRYGAKSNPRDDSLLTHDEREALKRAEKEGNALTHAMAERFAQAAAQQVQQQMAAESEESKPEPTPRRRGRPPGSKNRPRDTSA